MYSISQVKWILNGLFLLYRWEGLNTSGTGHTIAMFAVQIQAERSLILALMKNWCIFCGVSFQLRFHFHCNVLLLRNPTASTSWKKAELLINAWPSFSQSERTFLGVQIDS